MNKENIVYRSSNGTSKISAELYLPPEGVMVRALLQISHGMCEYFGRYHGLAEYFCQKGYAVFGNDHLGHKNTAILNHDQLGYFGPTGSRAHLVEDLELLRREVARRYPEAPCILLGHSMGSFIARLYAARYGSELSGLVLCGTAGRHPMITAGKALAGSLMRLKGPRYISDTVYQSANGGFNHGFPNPQTPVDWISRDVEVCNAYLRDPYCNFKFTVSAYYELFCMLERCNSAQWFQSLPKQLPILLIAGDRDPVGQNGAGPIFVYEQLHKYSQNQTEIKLYPDGRHEILSEPERFQVYRDVEAWADPIIQRGAMPEFFGE